MQTKAITSAVALLCAAPLLAQTSSLTATPITQVYDPSPWSAERFGRDVLLDDATALVLYGSTTSTYLVRCMVDVLGSWTYPASPGLSTQGYTMSFEGNLYLQGFPYGYGPSQLDRVAVWRRNGSAWTQSWLNIPDIGPADETFGVSTDIDGTTVVIGNHFHTQSLSEEGAVYVYEDTGSSLVLRQRIFGGVAGARIGVTVRVSGDDLLVYYNAAPTAFGVRAYRRQSGVWVLTQPDIAPVGQLSGGIELERGLAVARTSGGGFHVLANGGGGWFIDATIPPLPGSAGAYDLELSDGVIAASDPEADIAAVDAGAVRLYARNDGWKLQATVVASDARSLDYFGYGVGLDGDRLMVGAPNDDDRANNAGAVYEFQLAHAPARVHCVPEKSSLGCVAHLGFAGTPSASSGAPFLLSASSVNSHRGGMLVYGTNGPAFLSYPGGVRCVAAPRRTTARQSSGGTPGAGDCSGSLAIDFNALVASGVDPLLFAGQSVDAQWLYRDPLGPSALASSDAVQFTIAP